jgi:tetratricopeptide (TPR) repeat protein
MDGTVGKRNPRDEVLDGARQAALDAARLLAALGGGLVRDRYDELSAELSADLRAWLLELPSFLSKKGRRAQGEELCDLLAPIFGAPYLDAERAIVVWESGGVDARAQGKEALAKARADHPDSCWPDLRSGYALEKEGYVDKALEHLELAVEKARRSAEKKDLRFAWDSLVQFHQDKGDRPKVLELSRKLLEEGPALAAELRVDTIVNPEPKVGRNDPCPCGSGKKYKRCCGAAA